MLKDRGNKKWTSLMLVEHQKKLREFKKNKNNKEKPDLEEHRLQKMNYILNKAINTGTKISIKYYKNQRYLTYKGKIDKINHNIIFLKNTTNNIYKLKIKNIIDITLI